MSIYPPPNEILNIFNPSNFQPETTPETVSNLYFQKTQTVEAINGSAASPAFSFSAEPDSGLYRKSTNTLALSIDSADEIVFGTTSNTFTNPIILPDGTMALPAIRFTSDLDTGIFIDALGLLNLGFGGNRKILISGSSVSIYSSNNELANYSFGTGVGFIMRDTAENTVFQINNDTSSITTTYPISAPSVELSSSFTLPRLTDTQRNALTPVSGMLIFNTSSNILNYYDGSIWVGV